MRKLKKLKRKRISSPLLSLMTLIYSQETKSNIRNFKMIFKKKLFPWASFLNPKSVGYIQFLVANQLQ